MLPQRVYLLFFLWVALWGLIACNGQESQPLPTLVPTSVLPTAETAVLPATSTPLPSVVVADPVEFVPIFTETACTNFGINGNRLGENIQCGFVSVPEDRQDYAQGRLRLAVVRIFSDNRTSDSVPLLFLQGGPGASILNRIENYGEQFIAPMLNERDIILFDPRGVGLSEPEMDCLELKLAYLQDLDQEPTDLERADNYMRALFACRDRLQSNGVNLAMYHSGTVAADVKDILQALEYEQVDLFGVSYGTRFAQQVMRDYPELVRTAVLDSVVPINDAVVSETTNPQHDSLTALFRACAQQPNCQSNYPNLEAVYNELQTTLAANPLPITLTDPIQGSQIEMTANKQTLDDALQWALPNSYMSPFIPKMLYDLRAGDTTLLSSMLSLPLLTYGDLKLGMMVSVLCTDQVFTLSPEQLATRADAFPQLGILSTVAAYDDGRFLANLCTEWGVNEPEASAFTAVNSDIPTLILAGELDTTTPPAFGRQVAETLSQSYFVQLPNQGHAPAFGSAAGCVQGMIRAFLQEPDVEPVQKCGLEQTELAFFAPYNGTGDIPLISFSTDELPFTITVPANWQAGDYNHFYWMRFQGDATFLAVQAAAITIEEWLAFLKDNYAGVGLETVPEYAGEVEINGRVWSMYTTFYNNQAVTFAFTHEAGITYHVSFSSTKEEHTTLYNNLLLPVLESLAAK